MPYRTFQQRQLPFVIELKLRCALVARAFLESHRPEQAIGDPAARLLGHDVVLSEQMGVRDSSQTKSYPGYL